MKQRLIYAALTLLLTAAPAAAQYAPAGGLPPYEILTILRSTGLDPIGQPVRRGRHYLVRAIGDDDREVRVVVDARSGGVLSITPVQVATRAPGGLTYGPYERMAPGYVPAEPPGFYADEAPDIDDGDPPIGYGPRPPASVPNRAAPARGAARSDNIEPPRVITATPQGGDDVASIERPAGAPPQPGLLPPPPERFPNRAPPVTAATPKPAKRAATEIPKHAPLPKPRPASSAPAASVGDAVPPVPSLTPSAPAATQVPN